MAVEIDVAGVFITAADLTPAGTITAFGGGTAPAGWLPAAGSAYSRTTYADLFTVIGITYGSGNGTTTFNMPGDNGASYAFVETFELGWTLNEFNTAATATWLNVHLGNDGTDPTDNLTHGLNAPLSDLLVKILVSTDGTDTNSFEPVQGIANVTFGWEVGQVDVNNILIQTGASGILRKATTGTNTVIDTQNWYYNIAVFKQVPVGLYIIKT